MSRHTLYAHLTKSDTSLRGQVHDLLDLACQSGCEIVATLTGDVLPHSHKDRSQLELLVDRPADSEVSLVCAWTVDRSGQSRQHIVITPKRNTLVLDEMR